MPCSSLKSSSQSPLTRGRGSKLDHKNGIAIVRASPLTRGRGSKLDPAELIMRKLAGTNETASWYA